MLKCREVAELANDYIDKNLPWHKSMAIGFHLAMCKHCAGFVSKLNLVIAIVREQPPETISDQDADIIVTKVLASRDKEAQDAPAPTQNR